MKYKTEWRIFDNRKIGPLEKYISSYLAGNIKNLTIKEEWIMLEQLKEKYVAALQKIETQDIEVLMNEKLNEVKEQIREQVISKHNDEILVAKLKVQAVEEMIADQAENEEAADENEENMEG